jgi:hypothetical protein
MHQLLAALALLRAPICVAILTAAILVLPSQTREIFQSIHEAPLPLMKIEIARISVALLLLSAAFLLSCLLLIRNAPTNRSDAVNDYRGLLEALAFGLALTPVLAVASLNIEPRLLTSRLTDNIDRADALMRMASMVIVGLVIAGLAFSHRVRNAFVRAFNRPLGWLGRIGAVRGLAIASAGVGAVIALTTLFPREFADVLGPVVVLFLFLFFLCVITSLLSYIYDRYEFPAIATLLAAALVWSLLGINNNHAIRTISTTAPELPDATSAFASWLKLRPDLNDYTTYPVYVVAAEGGGTYAAAHAASLLARIQDSCPAFARHVFALSGVSGGSVGLSVFAALAKVFPPDRPLAGEKRCPANREDPGPLQDAVRDYFREDLVTPLLAAGLFPDFLQRFFPIPIGAFDRARALEFSFEGSWRKVIGRIKPGRAQDIFSENVRDMWDASRDTPALLLNTTVIQTGHRAIVAPFRLRGGHPFADALADILNEASAIRLSTAVGASARYPLVLPPAVVGEGIDARQLVDGGYFENSGVQTATDLIEKIKSGSGSKAESMSNDATGVAKQCAKANTASVALDDGRSKSVCFKLIVIWSYLGQPRDPSLSGEILSPFVALYKSSFGKGYITAQSAIHKLCDGDECGWGPLAKSPHSYVHRIKYDDLALGWLISEISLERIIAANHGGHDCDALSAPNDPEKHRNLPRNELYELENACLYGRISKDLVGD